eukprot:612678-Hanusia_phi.AAC.1
MARSVSPLLPSLLFPRSSLAPSFPSSSPPLLSLSLFPPPPQWESSCHPSLLCSLLAPPLSSPASPLLRQLLLLPTSSPSLLASLSASAQAIGVIAN